MNWKRILKWTGITVGALLGFVVLFIGFQLWGFGRAVARVYDVPPPDVVASDDSVVIARGQHLAESIGGCQACHGPGMGGQLVEDMGPIGVFHGPNLTTGTGGLGNSYTDGELARAVRHGIKRDGRTVLFMPSMEFNWWPDEDLVAIVSYIRSLPPVDNAEPQSTVGLLGKLLDQFDMLPMTIAPRIDHEGDRPNAPDPEPTAEYGQYLVMSCFGCHGEGLSGGKIPGAPATFPIPSNLTPHETGLAGWTEADFVTLLNTGARPDGSEMDPFMPIAMTSAMNDIEKSALWAYLRTLEPVEFGNR
ncbi:MAG: c-type cytochrome [Gemmatimonadetes bacterium]|nr:c-type cytochrome [Gemmatimonadota bacterium]MCH8992955.1 c-type cytochrome [Acidobacteriota bacterium]